MCHEVPKGHQCPLLCFGGRLLQAKSTFRCISGLHKKARQSQILIECCERHVLNTYLNGPCALLLCFCGGLPQAEGIVGCI